MSEKIAIALVGLSGVVIGSVITVAGNFFLHWLKQRDAARKDEPRKRLLRDMLKAEDYTWRRFDTLQHVIGADEETTKRLLIEIGARASEDGKPLWGLISRNPLPEPRDL